ncbi:MobP2 family relaxase [Virgibacillus salexigens]|uniref:MobP2 family relaxase n=1 Tax=Virgibacillus massiliensis TaxID=1462526 RepID=UPI00136B5458|nr:MobP2 family relaxase [Virgibacillus massiliensis]MYL43960.1 hypothetical protein [Virgibacillus massiliensis]
MSLETNKKASVIITSQFVQGDSKRFKDYVNYLDRKEAKNNNDFSLYNNYMDDEKKSTSLFTYNQDDLSIEGKEKLKEAFKLAQNRGSILWQDVVSFDNEWLSENGIYDKKTKTVDEKKLKDITRLAMKDMLGKSNIDNNAIWSGAIHHNTDNIHIHLATVELTPSGDSRGIRKLKTLEKMKSTYINKIMDRSKEHEKINNIIRNKIVNDKKQNKTFHTFNWTFKKDFMEIYKALPENQRYWNYGYQNINHIKPKLNELTKNYIDKHYRKEYQEFERLLDEEVNVLKKSYGEGKQKKYEQYKQNKIDDLYKRMGNAFLKEMKEYDKKINNIQVKKSHEKPKMKQLRKAHAMQQLKYGLDRLINNELKHNKNQVAYERLQQAIEREGQR